MTSRGGERQKERKRAATKIHNVARPTCPSRSSDGHRVLEATADRIVETQHRHNSLHSTIDPTNFCPRPQEASRTITLGGDSPPLTDLPDLPESRMCGSAAMTQILVPPHFSSTTSCPVSCGVFGTHPDRSSICSVPFRLISVLMALVSFRFVSFRSLCFMFGLLRSRHHANLAFLSLLILPNTSTKPSSSDGTRLPMARRSQLLPIEWLPLSPYLSVSPWRNLCTTEPPRSRHREGVLLGTGTPPKVTTHATPDPAPTAYRKRTALRVCRARVTHHKETLCTQRITPHRSIQHDTAQHATTRKHHRRRCRHRRRQLPPP